MMNTHLSKSCADFLRESFALSTGIKLKASHAHELVAAYFGYKSHAALLADKKYPIDKLDEARFLIPDVVLLEKRRKRLTGIPRTLPNAQELSSKLSSFLKEEGYFDGKILTFDSLKNYIMEDYLPDNDDVIEDELSGVMAGTNAIFDDLYYNSANISENEGELIVQVDGTYSGTNLDGKPFSGDQIDIRVTVTLMCVASRRGFLDLDFSIGGSVKDDWRDDSPNFGQRPKEQFIEETGGFRIGETPEQFKKRQVRIKDIRKKISAGNATVEDVDILSVLLGTNEDGYWG